MTFAFKAGIASAALSLAAGAAITTPATAADLGYGRGSIKDGYVAPMPEVQRGAAGPCYVRADIGYSLSGDPDTKWPVNNGTWVDVNADNIVDNGEVTSTFVSDAVSGASIQNTWLAEAGIGCGSGSRGFRAEAVLGYRGDRKFDGQPAFYDPGPAIGTDFNPAPYVPEVLDDPMHTSLRTYTMMLNVYKDLGQFGPVTPYVGAGIGAAYHMMSEVYFTGNPNLTNRIAGNNDLSFAWALMAGVGYQISDRAILDFGYRYIDLGKATSGRVDNAGFVNPRVVMDDLTAHEFKVGLRYHFGQSDCCGAQAYAPMK
ncbi:MAG: acyloxyacyl hydrolase [Hyphomicrobium sp.]